MIELKNPSLKKFWVENFVLVYYEIRDSIKNS